MKKEIAEAWVKDLRTDPPQTFGVLFDGNGYCCLGRLALILGETNEKIKEVGTLYYGQLEMAGMKHSSAENLASLNDSGVWTFQDIADQIEKGWEEL